MSDGHQQTLDVGDTRPPRAIETNSPSLGGVATMVMCAHRSTPADLMGWYTHDPDAVIRGLVQESAAVVVAELLGLTHATRRESAAPPPSAPISEYHEWLATDPASTQTTLTDGGSCE